MNRRLHRAVRRWLRYERLGRDRRAEGALRTVFARLPAAPVPAGLAARVLARAGVLAPLPVRRVAWSLRAATAVCLLLGGVAVLLLPPTVVPLAGSLEIGSVLEGAATAVAGAGRRFAVGVTVWRAVSDAGILLAEALTSPAVLVTLATSLVLSTGLFRLLSGLMLTERNRRHA